MHCKRVVSLRFCLIAGSMLLSSPVFASSYADCKYKAGVAENVPCVVDSQTAKTSLAEMMLANPDGYKKLFSPASFSEPLKYGLVFVEGFLRVTILKQSADHGGWVDSATIQYEVLLGDCKGTEVCGPLYLWTATGFVSTIHGGLSNETRFSNTLTPTDGFPQ